MDERAEKWQRLVDLLEEVDSLQQSLLGEKNPVVSAEIFELLNAMADDFIDLANAEGYEIV